MKLAYPYVLSERKTDAALAWEGEYKTILPLIAETGYSGIELLAYKCNEYDLKGIQKTLAEQKLPAVAMGTGLIEKLDGLSLVHADDYSRQKARKEVKQIIETAADFNAPVVIGRVRGRWNPLGSKEKGNSYFREALEDLLEHAGKLGVKLMIEPQSETASDFINTVEEAVIWCEEYGELSMVYDTFHMERTENSLYKALRKAESHIGLVHIADTEREAPGKGRIDFKRVLTTLEEMNYGGFCSLEVRQTPDPETVCRESYNYIKQELNE